MTVKIYAERDLMALDKEGNHYCRHISAMTSEGLHSKSDIAAELGWRDMQITELQRKVEALAVENASLKAVSDDRRQFIMSGVQLGYIKVPTAETDPALETIRLAVSPQEPTPATDSLLAEIRAQGMLNFVPSDEFLTELIRASNRGASPEEYRSAMREVFAQQLRKESGQ